LAKRRYIRKAVRNRLLEDALFRCCLCRERVALTLDFHHIIPISEYGPDTEENLVVVCPNCHRAIEVARRAGLRTYTPEQLRDCKRRWIELCRRDEPATDRRIEQTPAARPTVSLAKLPVTGPDLFGREAELRVLDDAWDDPDTHIVALVAFGGVGKSAVVNHWLRQMKQERYRGARRVFGWSFYAQGHREQTISADVFVEEALSFFGADQPWDDTPWKRGERLASLVREQPTILVIDGLEPLQSSMPGEIGRVNEPTISVLLRELAYEMDGICILTSRVNLPDIPLSDDSGPARRIYLERLPTAAGRQILRRCGISGSDSELNDAVAEYEGHALALVILGEYLAKFLGGAIRQRDFIPPFPDNTSAGRHAFRVMDAYDRSLVKAGLELEREILRLVSLFDYPVPLPLLRELCQGPAVASVTDLLRELKARDWREAIGLICEWRLLTQSQHNRMTVLDAHPLVRDWFSHALQRDAPDSFRAIQSRICDHLVAHVPEFPGDLKELTLLFRAAHHGCRAGRHSEVLREVYQRRIQHGTRGFAAYKFGTAGLSIGLLSRFMEEPWSQPLRSLSPEERCIVLSSAGYHLQAVGDLAGAVDAESAALRELKMAGAWSDARAAASMLVDLHVAGGDLHAAHEASNVSEDLARRSGSRFALIASLTDRGHVLHLKGELGRALTAFSDAETVQRDRSGEYPLLYSYQGACYCALLLDVGAFEQVATRSTQTLEWYEEVGDPWLLDAGLDRVMLARALHGMCVEEAASPSDAEELAAQALPCFDRAVNDLRAVQSLDMLPMALINRAAFHRDRGSYDLAQRDLLEALDTALRIGLRLHEVDARVLSCHLALDENASDLSSAEDELRKAGMVVSQTGYRLRAADLLILEGRLALKGGDTARAAQLIHEACTAAGLGRPGCRYRPAALAATRDLRSLDEKAAAEIESLLVYRPLELSDSLGLRRPRGRYR